MERSKSASTNRTAASNTKRGTKLQNLNNPPSRLINGKKLNHHGPYQKHYVYPAISKSNCSSKEYVSPHKKANRPPDEGASLTNSVVNFIIVLVNEGIGRAGVLYENLSSELNEIYTINVEVDSKAGVFAILLAYVSIIILIQRKRPKDAPLLAMIPFLTKAGKAGAGAAAKAGIGAAATSGAAVSGNPTTTPVPTNESEGHPPGVPVRGYANIIGYVKDEKVKVTELPDPGIPGSEIKTAPETSGTPAAEPGISKPTPTPSTSATGTLAETPEETLRYVRNNTTNPSQPQFPHPVYGRTTPGNGNVELIGTVTHNPWNAPARPGDPICIGTSRKGEKHYAIPFEDGKIKTVPSTSLQGMNVVAIHESELGAKSDVWAISNHLNSEKTNTIPPNDDK